MSVVPYEQKLLQFQEFINEILFLGIFYHLVLFTGIILDKDTLY